MITIPALFDNALFNNGSLNYEWDPDSYGYFLDEIENLRIANLHTELSYKATLAFGAALNEWIIWRLHQPALAAGITEAELRLHYNAIEAAWAVLSTLITQLYSTLMNYIWRLSMMKTRIV